MSNYSIGNRIRELRAKYKLSQEELALRADITPAYLGQIERDERNPTIKVIEKIADIFALSLSQFFDDNSCSNVSNDGCIGRIVSEMTRLSASEKARMADLIREIIDFKKGDR